MLAQRKGASQPLEDEEGAGHVPRSARGCVPCARAPCAVCVVTSRFSRGAPEQRVP